MQGQQLQQPRKTGCLVFCGGIKQCSPQQVQSRSEQGFCWTSVFVQQRLLRLSIEAVTCSWTPDTGQCKHAHQLSHAVKIGHPGRLKVETTAFQASEQRFTSPALVVLYHAGFWVTTIARRVMIMASHTRFDDISRLHNRLRCKARTNWAAKQTGCGFAARRAGLAVLLPAG